MLSRATDLIRYATDASPYRLFPKVVLAHTVEDVRAVFRYAQERDLPVTLRAAGTSPSGQAQSDGILLEVKRHWVVQPWKTADDACGRNREPFLAMSTLPRTPTATGLAPT